MPKGSRERTQIHQTQSGTSNTSTPGTAFGTSVLQDVQNSGIEGQIFGQTPYTGNVVAAAPDLGAGNYTAQWGPTPTTFVPQRTAADAPTQVTRTNVDRNYVPGIAAGLAATGTNSSLLAPATANLGNYWNTIAAGGGADPRWDDFRAAFTAQHQDQAAFNAGQRALYAGADGAFGGTPSNQANAFSVGQEENAFNSAMAELGLAQLTNEQQMQMAAPGQLQQVADLGTRSADDLLAYGGLQQANLAQAAASGDYNAQVLQNNLHNAQSLNDANAVLAAQEAIAQWEAVHQSEASRVADLQGQTAAQTGIEQAGYDNALHSNMAVTDNLNSELNQLMVLLGLARGVPGSTTTSSGTMDQSQTTRTSQQPGLADFAGLIGSALMAIPTGGMSLLPTALGAAGTAASSGAGISNILSDRRVKKNLEHVRTDTRGVKWYLYNYVWQSDNDLTAYGVIAQELKEIAPQFVHNNNGLLSVDYAGLNEWRPNYGNVAA